jgi:hypothetical protein
VDNRQIAQKNQDGFPSEDAIVAAVRQAVSAS